MNYSGLAIRQGEGQSARLLAEEALSNARELGFVAGVIISLQYLGDAARVLHDCEGAESLFAEGLALAEDASLKTEIAYSLYGLGFVALEQKDHAEAALKFRRYLTLSHELGHRWEIAEAVVLGWAVSPQAREWPIVQHGCSAQQICCSQGATFN